MSDFIKTKKLNLFGGIRVKNLEHIDTKFICAVCTIVLYRPYQLHCCGAFVCEWCFLDGLSDRQPFVCPYCATKQAKKEASFDRAMDREMKKLPAECFNCIWKGYYSDYLDHLKNKHCDFSCNGCNERFFTRNTYEQHRKELCIHRSLPCGLPGCDTSIKWYDMPAHYLSSKHQCILQHLVSKLLRSKNRKERRREYHDILEIHQVTHSSYEIVYKNHLKVKTELEQLKTIANENIAQITQLKTDRKESEGKIQELYTDLVKIASTMESTKQTQKEPRIPILDSNSCTTLSLDFSVDSISGRMQTSTYGYMFILHLSAITIGNKKYLSLTLNLLNEDYNNLLPFPFTHDIHVIIWDQSNENQHLLRIIKPSLCPEAFTRPISEKNEDCQISDFCLLEKLTSSDSRYVKDGKIFLRLFVDFLNRGENPFDVKTNDQTDDGTAMNTD